MLAVVVLALSGLAAVQTSPHLAEAATSSAAFLSSGEDPIVYSRPPLSVLRAGGSAVAGIVLAAVGVALVASGSLLWFWGRRR